MKKSAVGVVVLLVAIVVVVFMVTKKDDSPTANTAPVSTNTNTSTADAPAQTTNTDTKIAIVDFMFNPAVTSIKKGTTVTWTNTDTAAHTVTSKSGSPESFASGSLAKSKTFTHTFNTVGEYLYVCDFHSAMQATIKVTE